MLGAGIELARSGRTTDFKSGGMVRYLSLTKRDETGCTLEAVDKVSLRLVSYQHVAAINLAIGGGCRRSC